MRNEVRLGALAAWIPLGFVLNWLAQPGKSLFFLGSAVFVGWALVAWLLATRYFGQFPAPNGSARWSAAAVIVLSWGLMTGMETLVARKRVPMPQSDNQWIQRRDDPQMLLDFIENYPESPHVDEARKLLRDGEEKFWNKAIGEEVPEMQRSRIATYLQAFPEGVHAQEAHDRLDDGEWTVARNAKRDEALVDYLTRHSKGRHVAEARAAIARNRGR